LLREKRRPLESRKNNEGKVLSSISDSRAVSFAERVREAGRLLDSVSLLDRENSWPQYSGTAKEARDKAYREQWEYFESRSLFDFQLTDGSLLQFKDRPEHHTDLSFCFYESPLDVDDYSTFVTQTYDLTVEDIGDQAREDYEAYLSTAQLKRAVVMLRYDHSPGLYREGCHPVSHLHIGHNNEIRLGTHRVMNPVSFALFVVRQVYPAHWQRFISASASGDWVKHVRESLPKIERVHLNLRDTWEAYLE